MFSIRRTLAVSLGDMITPLRTHGVLYNGPEILLSSSSEEDLRAAFIMSGWLQIGLEPDSYLSVVDNELYLLYIPRNLRAAPS